MVHQVGKDAVGQGPGRVEGDVKEKKDVLQRGTLGGGQGVT